VPPTIEFTRDDYRGLDLDWFAVDRRGGIGIFTTGYGAIPKAVFESEERYRQLWDFFSACPESSEARFVGEPSGELFLQEARRGLYSYWQCGYSVFDPYELIAYPVTPLMVDALPDAIRAVLRPFHCERLDFPVSRLIVVQDYFECD
jgi:hypothetical protein